MRSRSASDRFGHSLSRPLRGRRLPAPQRRLSAKADVVWLLQRIHSPLQPPCSPLQPLRPLAEPQGPFPTKIQTTPAVRARIGGAYRPAAAGAASERRWMEAMRPRISAARAALPSASCAAASPRNDCTRSGA